MTATRKRVEVDDLVGVAEISEVLGVPRTNVTTLMNRRSTNKFPEPLVQLRMGGLYSRSAVAKWGADRGYGLKPDAVEQLVEA